MVLVAERKDGVLEILLKTEEDVLDDKGLVVALKEAKAKVFEILNDLNLEKKNLDSKMRGRMRRSNTLDRIFQIKKKLSRRRHPAVMNKS